MAKKIKINDITLNIVENEQFVYTNEATEKSIEKQNDITDHIKQKPLSISLLAYFIDPTKSIGLSYFADREEINSVDKMKQLLELNKNKEIITYEGITKKVEDLVFESISEIRTSDFNNAIQLDIRLKQIKTVEQKSEETKELQKTGKDPQTGKDAEGNTKDSGKKTPTETPKKKSKIKSIYDTFTGG